MASKAAIAWQEVARQLGRPRRYGSVAAPQELPPGREAAGLRVRNEVTDVHRNEVYGRVVATVNGAYAGYLKWSEFRDEALIHMIEVEPSFRRMGIGMAMYRALRADTTAKIKWGVMTPEGRALYRQLKARREL